MTASSRPTVDTQYPRAQKRWLTKFLFLPIRPDRWIALFLLINPITCDTAYLGRIAVHHVRPVGQRVPFFDPILHLLGQLAEHLTQVPPQFPYSTCLRICTPAGMA